MQFNTDRVDATHPQIPSEFDDNYLEYDYVFFENYVDNAYGYGHYYLNYYGVPFTKLLPIEDKNRLEIGDTLSVWTFSSLSANG